MLVLVACMVLSLVGIMEGQQTNLMQNPGFESPLSGHWEATGFTMTIVDDAYEGSKAAKFSNRRGFYQGPAQLLNVRPGKLYYYKSYVKQLNDMPGHMFQRYRVNIGFHFTDPGSTEQLYVVHHTSVRSSDGWFRVAGYFRAPARAFDSALLHYQAPDTGIEFLLDSTSLTEVAENPDWKQAANQRIQEVRMSNVTLHFTLPAGVNGDDVQILVDQKKHEFAFGTLIRDQWLTDAAHRKYQNTLYTYFNTATTQAVKWRYDQGTQGHPDYSDALVAIDELRKHGMRVRGHNMFWGYNSHVPDYVKHMSGATLNDTVLQHLHYMVNITKGKLDHWDVMNELLHSQWFESQTGDRHYSEMLYKLVHSLDPKPLLLLNDYAVIAGPEIADAYVQQAQRYQARGVPLHGLGVQGHFHQMKPDPELMRLNLDTLAQAGLPVWVTEMDVWQRDENVRADYLEDVLRLFFSHPSVEGVVLWGFWTQAIVSPLKGALFDAHLEPNEAGRRYIQLTKNEWSTHYNSTLQHGDTLQFRGFHGDYDLTIKLRGHTVKVMPFKVTGSHTTISATISPASA